MAYMPEVRNGLQTCRAVLSGASQPQRPTTTADAERAAGAEGQVAVVCRATAGHAAVHTALD